MVAHRATCGSVPPIRPRVVDGTPAADRTGDAGGLTSHGAAGPEIICCGFRRASLDAYLLSPTSSPSMSGDRIAWHHRCTGGAVPGQQSEETTHAAS
jgi:hypothetical protein